MRAMLTPAPQSSPPTPAERRGERAQGPTERARSVFPWRPFRGPPRVAGMASPARDPQTGRFLPTNPKSTWQKLWESTPFWSALAIGIALVSLLIPPDYRWLPLSGAWVSFSVASFAAAAHFQSWRKTAASAGVVISAAALAVVYYYTPPGVLEIPSRQQTIIREHAIAPDNKSHFIVVAANALCKKCETFSKSNGNI